MLMAYLLSDLFFRLLDMLMAYLLSDLFFRLVI